MKNKIFTLVITFLIIHCTLNIDSCMCQWVQTNGPYGGTVYSLAINGNNIFAGTGNGVHLSTNTGISWMQTSLTQITYSLTTSGINVFAGTDANGVYISTNNGANWAQTTLNNRVVYSLASSGNNIFAGTIGIDNCRIFHSTDNGTSWTQSFVSSEFTFYSLAINGNNIFAGCGGFSNGVYISTNNGTNWGLNNYTFSPVISLAYSGNKIFAGTHADGIFKSTNNGINWLQTNLNNNKINSLAASVNNTFTGTQDSGFYFSTNNGNTWIKKNDGFGIIPTINALILTDSFIFAGTETYSVWKRPLSELITGIKNNYSEVPSSYSLEQNYPNPFNPSTIIRYQITNNKHITIKIFDILGKEAATLVNEKQQAGTYEVTFDGTNLTSGIYFYSLYADGVKIDTKRMVLIK